MRLVSKGIEVSLGVGLMAFSCLLLEPARANERGSSAQSPQEQRPSVSRQSPNLLMSRQSPNLVTPALVSGHAFLDTYCVACHNERRRTAGLALDKIDLEHVSAATETLEKVVQKLRTGAMPPPGVPRPGKPELNAFVARLEGELDRDSAADPNPGRPAIHRLNRVEYTNSVRDLLGLEIDGRALLPADRSDYGFDNIADALSVSPGLLDRYLSAARKISRLAVGDPSIHPTVARYSIPWLVSQDERSSEDLPFGSRGGTAIRHYFPLDGQYILNIKLQRGAPTYQLHGSLNPDELDIRLDGVRVKLASMVVNKPTPKPAAAEGNKPTGRAAIRYGVTGLAEVPSSESAKSLLAIGSYDYVSVPDWDFEVRLTVKAGLRTIGMSFPRKTFVTEGMRPERLPRASYAFLQDGPDAKMGVDSFEIRPVEPFVTPGPPDTPSRRKLFVCRPTGAENEESCAKTILSTVAHRAYRRPVTAADVQTLFGFYDSGRRAGGFDAGIELALERVLISPDFLYRVEGDPANVNARSAVYALSDLELASRLSFFLWSSIPDTELLDIAEKGKLKDPTVLDQQVRRMLLDSRSEALVTNFGSQWLQLRSLRSLSAPDPTVFPEFDDSLRSDFQRETELFLESQLREDRSVLDVLTANYTFVNERLARHYGIPQIHGEEFRRISLPDDVRGGLLGQGSILMLTSYPTRTSPVLRGKWVLESLLGAPPPPPPPNVPALKENGEGGSHPTSVRERLEEHRKNPVCASCHARMDPLGFALENFDGIGKWRSTDTGVAIDAAATLPDGTQFQGPKELRELLLSRSDDFVATVTRKLLTYALGRGLEYYDMPAVRKIAGAAAHTDNRWSSLILGIVKSTPFQMRRTES